MQLSVSPHLSHMTLASADIFDSIEHWQTAPTVAYASWLAHQRHLKPSTKVVYRAMFNRFCEWLTDQGQRLEQVTAGDIERFLDTPNPNLPPSREDGRTGRLRQQYVRLLESVFDHLERLGDLRRNPGRDAAHQKIGSGKDKPTRFLSRSECEAVIGFLKQRLADLGTYKPEEQESWVEFRDVAIVAAVLGAGLKVEDLKRLTLNCMNLTHGYFDLSTGNDAHRARLLTFAVPPIQTWLEVLKQIHGVKLGLNQKVFTANRTSSGRGIKCRVVTPSSSSIHRRTHRLLEMAGIEGHRASAQTLRNTYAGMLIDAGVSNGELIDNLGLKAVRTAQHLRAAYSKHLKTDADDASCVSK